MSAPEVCGASYGTGKPHPHGMATCARPAGHPEVSEDGIGHSPDPIPVRPAPAKGTATGAMRLRPSAQPARPRDVHPDEAGPVTSAESARALDELRELHSQALVGLCRECITPHPCRTVQLAELVAGIRTPREDSTQ